MVLHNRHAQSHVRRGLEAREHLRLLKRDSHRSTPMMNVPEGFDLQQKDANDGPATAVSVVYVTLSKTFSGPAEWKTLTNDPNAAATSAHPTHSANDAQNTGESKPSQDHASNPQAANTPIGSGNANTTAAIATASPSSIIEQVGSSAANAGSSASNGPSVLLGAPLQATPTSSSSVSSSTSNPQTMDQTSSQMSGGARAGLAFGIILAIAAAAALIYYSWRRKNSIKVQEENLMNEKHGSFADTSARQVEAGAKRGSIITEKAPISHQTSQSASTAPRLSLRPLTQFLPNLAENDRNTSNNLGIGGAALSEKPRSAWERQPSASNQNPFDDEKRSRPNSPPTNPFDESEARHQNPVAMNGNRNVENASKSSWEGTEPPTPRSVRDGNAGPIPVSAGGPKELSPPRGPNNVHRVQLDFKPSMEDELELRSGQLVRMLHEYDDGWALCIRMDRSQQGVAPRTCLSKLPVKPRPQGPPPGSRPGTSQGPRRPSNPPHPMNGQSGGAMYPRPLTPTQANSSSSPTGSQLESSMSPANVVPQRKPVPGQAM